MNNFFLTLFGCLLMCSFVYAEDNPVIKNILNRKSVRQYTSQNVEKEKIDAIIKAGMAAPSAVNLQPWEIILITDRKILNEVAQNIRMHPLQKMLPLRLLFAVIPKKALIIGYRTVLPLLKISYWLQSLWGLVPCGAGFILTKTE